MTNPKFECSVLHGKICGNGRKICCYYCSNLRECLKKWNKSRSQDIFCEMVNRDRYCSLVRDYCNDYGIPKHKIKVLLV